MCLFLVCAFSIGAVGQVNAVRGGAAIVNLLLGFEAVVAKGGILILLAEKIRTSIPVGSLRPALADLPEGEFLLDIGRKF